MVTITEVAKKAGVSPTTASYALNGRSEVKEKTRERVLKAAKELNYIPNKLAQSFRNGKTNTITVITNEAIESENTFTGEFFGILAEARSRHYDVLVKLVDSKENSANIIKSIFNNSVSDGFLLLGNLPDRYLQYFVESKSCGVLISSHSDKNIVQINCDGRKGIYDITKLAVSKGHRELEYLTYQLITEEEKLRSLGFSDALSETGINEVKVTACGYDRGSIVKTVEKSIDNGVTCFICWNDILAYTIIDILKDMKIKVPEQVCITGFDDIVPNTGKNILTTVHQPFFEKGRKAMELLISQINNKSDRECKTEYLIECKIVKRKSL